MVRWRVLGSVLVMTGVLALVAVDAFARGGGGMGGGGRGGGGMGGGRGGGRGGAGRGGMGRGAGGGFGGMGRGAGGAGAAGAGKNAKEWQALQQLEERMKLIQGRRDKLIDDDRKATQETLLADRRLEAANGLDAGDVR
jgi:hypothetical protein